VVQQQECRVGDEVAATLRCVTIEPVHRVGARVVALARAAIGHPMLAGWLRTLSSTRSSV
jgi:hypothetical protein